jgi:hypothetical protein
MTTTSRGEPPPDTPCPCGHTADEHDAVAARYCQATAQGGMHRRCICVPVSVPRPDDGMAVWKRRKGAKQLQEPGVSQNAAMAE